MDAATLDGPCLPVDPYDEELPVTRRPVHALALILLSSAGSAIHETQAGDWPQILGPLRNGQAVNEPDLKPWPQDGPRKIWSAALGAGYAGPAVFQDRVVAFHREGDQERLEALDAATGRKIWSAQFDAAYNGGIDPDKGPRCVPVIHQGRVLAFGAAGSLHCVALQDGHVHWTRSLASEFAGKEGYFGFGSTPIIEAEKVLINLGGAKAGIVALNLQDGQTAWKSTDEDASYSSPTRTTIGDKPCVVFVTRLNAVGIDPRDGTVQFRFPFGKRGPTVNAATPLVIDNRLFLSASYGIGAELRTLTSRSAERVWSNDDTMSSQYSTCVHYQGHLFGFHGRDDVGEVELRCFELATGQIKWRKAGVRPGHLILVHDQLLILTADGQLQLAPATPQGFEPTAAATVSPHVTRAMPALAGGRLFFRDNSQDGGGTLSCLQLNATHQPPP